MMKELETVFVAGLQSSDGSIGNKVCRQCMTCSLPGQIWESAGPNTPERQQWNRYVHRRKQQDGIVFMFQPNIWMDLNAQV